MPNLLVKNVRLLGGDRVDVLMQDGVICGFRKEEDFEMLLDIATCGGASVMGDEGYGLAVGKQADFAIIPGATPTEAIVTRPPRTLVVKRGRIVAQ